MLDNNLIKIEEMGFNTIISSDRKMPFISFRKSCPYYGQWLYLIYYRDTGFEFIGKLAKHLNLFGPVKVYKEWQSREVGFDLNEFFESCVRTVLID